MGTTTYVRYRWLHDFADEPEELWSELDESGFEVRKLEYFRDGTVGFADSLVSSSGTRLADQAFPSDEDIIADGELEKLDVSEAAFEERWQKRREPHSMQ